MALVGFRSQMLWENIRKGDLSAVVNLLENGTINLEERDENGQTFLMVACQQGEISLARELLDAGIDPNATDNDNWTSLLYAAKDGYLEVCIELLERDADIEHRDLCNWTALMWAAYKGRNEVVQELLDRDADPNIKAEQNMSCLGWAAGRGHLGVVKALLEKGARVNSTDKYGTTPLIWACRKGHAEIVSELLHHGALVDNTGMDSLTALLVATKGGYTEVVQALVEHDPNVNAVDKDGFTALTIAAKEGYEDIVQELLPKDAYVNIADRVGDTILIHAVKGGYTGIVRALLNRYADVDVEGNERKTALYWAVEKGHADIVKLLLENDADMEISTKDGDTPLMRAVRNRNELIVRILLDKGAKVAVYDKKGDTALHISLRARSKRITELLLRNPRNSRLLYRPNKAGETPYSIDAYHQKGILTQIHGHRQLNASDGENLLGYEIYSSSLADILSEPSLNTPITVGLYAKWGSGKSFLIDKLKSEMKSFTKANDDNQLTFTLSLFIFLFIVNSIIGSVLALSLEDWRVGLGVGLGLFVWEYGFLGIIWICSTRYNVHFARRISLAIGKRLQILTLLLQILFCNPVSRSSSNTDVPLVKFLFSESTKLTSVGGEKALAAMIAGLSESVEKEFGMISARLFGVLKHVSDKNYIGRFKTVCCIPIFVIVGFVLLCLIVGISLLVTCQFEDRTVNGLMIALAAVVGLSLLSNIHNIGRAFLSMCIPQRRRIMKAAERVHHIKIDGFMQILKYEVGLMNRLVMSIDKFTKNTTRLVVIVDGLDSCEQEKVLQVLDIIHSLFNVENSSFVVILAVDPQIIIKGIDQNLKSVFHDTAVNGFDYLRNIVHLPFYLQSQGLQAKKQRLTKSVSTYDVNHESPTHNHKAYRRKDSTVSGFSLCEAVYQHQDSTVSQISGFSVVDPSIKKGRAKPRTDSLSQVTHSNFDISHTLTKNDYFSDINPKSMRRLMNIVAVTGRLLRAYNIDFNWYRLAAWVNLVEQWPYRLSWCILYFEEHDDLSDDVTLKFIYDKIVGQMPSSSEVEPLLEIDRNVRKLHVFLSSKSSSSPMLSISDLKKFLPCTINLDPYLRKLIRNLQQQMTQPELPMNLYNSPPNLGATKSSQEPAAQLRTTLHRTPLGKQPLGTMHPSHMMPYGPMMYPHMMGMQNPYMMGMGVVGAGPGTVEDVAVSSKKPINPGQYITGYKGEILSELSTNEVSTLLARIAGINLQQLPKYQDAVIDNNINGMVLSQCELDDLGKCLQMKFGDWQLFLTAVKALREAETDPPEQPQKEETDISASAVKRNKSGSGAENNSRTIHFSSTDDVVSPPQRKNSLEQVKSRGTFRRQSTVDTDKGTDSNPAFDMIEEEIDDDEEVKLPPSRSAGSMKRNDSVVAQMMYESNLLHEFVHNFTENVSGEDDNNEDSAEEMLPNGDIIQAIKADSDVVQTSSVEFSLLMDHQHEDENQSLGSTIHESENEPLLAHVKSFKKSTSLGGPVPTLRLPEFKTATFDGKSIRKNVYSEPDLLHPEKHETTLYEENQPLLATSKSVSVTSSGFADTGLYAQGSVKSNESINCVSVVDETSPRQDNTRATSIEESIQMYTMQNVGTSQRTGDAESQTGTEVQLITQKNRKEERKSPVDFV
ncbi:kinase D-interacting substrate of 220 kDa B-like isoform X2 [Mercenaria mercenaria]|uniref:kinase D-interacting substrate of 220 kDa B-like isoform X2 n=1 Tax=Mercenaria mercenaria TaxID=6596 RepID=UPI00234F4F0A|nr:kinase D-interacting substrate of 220 kDa B-like isoform X2 [Mercenaria mercenaria]